MSCSLVRCSSFVILALLAVLGCSKKEAGFEADAALPAASVAESYNRGEEGPRAATAMSRAAAVEGLPGEGATTTPEGVDRKIIYTADVELVVEDFTGVPERVVELVKKYEGYVADSNLSGTVGTNRRAMWRIRVPVAKFEEFLDASKGLGELLRLATTSQDVSEEYYDVEARIRNKTKEEERLIKLLEERPGELADVIAIERELSRVREEIERMQGRMRVLADLTSLTTVNLTINEIRDYVPKQAPTFVTRIHWAFEGSLAGLRTTGENLAIAAVALAPWLVVGVVVVAPCFIAVRRQWRRWRTERAAAAVPTLPA